VSAHGTDDGGDDPFRGLEPAVAEAAKNAIYDTRMLCRMKGFPALEVDSIKLMNILRRSYSYASIADPLLRVAKVSSNMVAGIINEQPFNYLSRHAAMILADAYQHLSGFQLEMGYFKVMDRDIVSPLEERKASQAELQAAIERFLIRYLKKKP